jgi:hypothetical protein
VTDELADRVLVHRSPFRQVTDVRAIGIDTHEHRGVRRAEVGEPGPS